jgi:Integrase zinc binding domain
VIDTVAEDALLPTPVLPRASPFINVPEPLEAISQVELLVAQNNDPWRETLWAQMYFGVNPAISPVLCVDEYGAMVCGPVYEDLPLRWVVPASLHERICTLAHYSKFSGHPGATRMIASIRHQWLWPSMAQDFLATVRGCPACVAKRLKRGRKRSVPLTNFPPIRPLEFVAIDVLGPLTTTARGNRFVLCITDRFSKMPVAIPLKD